jgi:diguanylate cyclase (GGDEF)-like protein
MNERVHSGRIDPVTLPKPTSTGPSASSAAGKRSRARPSLSRHGVWAAATAAFVAAAAAGALLGAQSVAHTDTDRGRLAFHLSSAEIASTLKLALQHEEDLVISASAVVAGNPQASAAGFDRWAESVHAMQRYPELQNIGLVELVPAPALPAFRARMAAHPLRPLSPSFLGPKEAFQVFPAGPRPYYCFAVAGLSRSVASYLPAGVDYCALAKTLLAARDSGASSYAPFVAAATTTLGVETPVYAGGVAPPTVLARRRAFVGWLGELLVPQLVLQRALEGHPNTAATFRYASGTMHVVFHSGRAPHAAQTTTIDLHNGWTVQTFGGAAAAGVLGDARATELLAGGILVGTLLGLLMFVLGTGRTRALSLVREKTRELSHQALHDALTGLPNRALVLDRAEQMLARAGRQAGIVPGALFVDVDGFKHVNDNLGHAAGDELLKVVGERLQDSVRDQDTVGRLGGDEFVVLVESESPQPSLDVLAERLIEVLRRPVKVGEAGKTLGFTASIGVAVGQYATPDELLRDADLALYAAKAAGKDRYAVFDASMDPHAGTRAELEVDLSAALWDEQFFLLYQPIFDLPSQSVVGAEALIRWQHPVRGVVTPDEFIPLAEETGLIVPIGRWVLDEACRQAAAWKAEGREIGICVNVSAFQLGREGFEADVRRALQESAIEPSLLTLEVTETTIMRDVAAACARLEEIKALGVRIAIDDFGTGYASLSHLQRMPVDILKVDRSFVAALDDGDQSRELLKAIMGVAQALSLTVIAEGIETRSQMATITEMGCAMAQGFLMGRPTAAEAIESVTWPQAADAPVGTLAG